MEGCLALSQPFSMQLGLSPSAPPQLLPGRHVQVLRAVEWATWTDSGKSRCLASASLPLAVKQPYAHTPACMAVDSGLLIALYPSHPSAFLLPKLKQLFLLSPTAGYSPGLFYNMALRGGTLVFLKPKSHR